MSASTITTGVIFWSRMNRRKTETGPGIANTDYINQNSAQIQRTAPIYPGPAARLVECPIYEFKSLKLQPFTRSWKEQFS
jgi:hypothetical protein